MHIIIKDALFSVRVLV